MICFRFLLRERPQEPRQWLRLVGVQGPEGRGQSFVCRAVFGAAWRRDWLGTCCHLCGGRQHHPSHSGRPVRFRGENGRERLVEGVLNEGDNVGVEC